MLQEETKFSPQLSRDNFSFYWSQFTHNCCGVTLIELMIAVTLSGFVVSAIYMSFKAQQRTSVVQENVTDIQQNLRAAAYVMGSEIRMAGYDPTDTTSASIDVATASTLGFTMDLNGDGDITDPGDNVTYDLYDSGTIPTLGRKAPAVNAAVAEYIENMEFLYFLKDGSNSTTPVTLSNIRSITISLVARSRAQDPNYTNTNIYTTASGTPLPKNDNYRRRMISYHVNCRNMGL